MKKRTVCSLLCNVVVGIALCHAARAADMPAPLNPPEKVVVAYVPIMKFSTLYVAAGRGIFEKHGLDVQLERVKSGTEVITFLAEGKMDVGGIALVSATWNAWNQEIDLPIIAPAALEPVKNSPTKFLVRKDLMENGTVKSIADLKGKVVAIAGAPGSGGEYLAAKGLERDGLTLSDVEIARLGNAEMPAAFANSSVDAGLVASPYANQIIADGAAVAIAEDLTPGAMTVAFVGSGKFVNERPEAAKRFVLSLMEAARLMQGENYFSAENIAAYMTYLNAPEEAIRKVEPQANDPNQQISIEGLADIERIHRQNGRVEYTVPIDVTKVVNSTFVEWALSVLGKAE